MQQPTELTIKLPDFDALTPFPWSGCNPTYALYDRTSTEWILSYGLLSKFNADRLVQGHLELMGAYCWPYADVRCLRIGSDICLMITAMDEYFDEQDTEGAKAACDTVVRALTGEADDDESPIAMIIKDFVKRLSFSPEELRNHIAANFVKYAHSLVNEAALREDRKIPSFEEFLSVRRLNGGCFTLFDFMEVAMDFVLPKEVREDSNFKNIAIAANDLITLANDIFSFPAEYSRGLDGMNSVALFMNSEGLSPQEAVDRVTDIYKKRADDMMACKAAMRSFGPEVDEMVQKYIYGLEQGVRGNLVWSLDTRRYFTDEERGVVKRTRIANVKPRGSAP